MPTKILARIRALLAMADPVNNASDQERETALRRANYLMDQHQISELDLGQEEDSAGPRGKTALDTGSTRWKTQVVNALAPLYGCKCYFTSGADGRTYLVGREQHREVLASMARWIWRTIDAEAQRQPSDRRYRNAFRKGAARGVRDSVERIIAERARPAASDSRALVLVDYYATELQLNVDWVASNVGTLSRTTSTHSSRDGFASGRTYGQSVSLRGQVSSRSTPKLR